MIDVSKRNIGIVTLGHLVAFLVVVIWGSTFVFTKILLLNGLTPAQIFTLRFIIAYVLLLIYGIGLHGLKRTKSKTGDSPCLSGKSVAGKGRWLCDSWQDELLMLALGVTGGSLYFLAENEALCYTTTTNTSLLVCSCPLLAAILIGLFYKSERLRPMQLTGSALALLGVAVVVLNGHFVLHLSPVGDGLALAAALCWAVYSLLIIPANKRYDAVFITRKVFFYGLLTMIPYYAMVPSELPTAMGGTMDLNVLLRPAVMGNLLFLGCVASLLCFVLWTWVMRCLGAIVATNYVYINPLATVVFAWLILAEPVTPFFVLGGVFILTGMYLADRKG